MKKKNIRPKVPAGHRPSYTSTGKATTRMITGATRSNIHSEFSDMVVGFETAITNTKCIHY